jgi:FKBP-type peptidyl-prolyl cis-trans isomerase SlyD
MESENGTAKNFIVTKIDEKTLTVDGNNPLCGREVKFTLKVLNVRKATNEELATGGAIAQLPDIGSANTIPI